MQLSEDQKKTGMIKCIVNNLMFDGFVCREWLHSFNGLNAIFYYRKMPDIFFFYQCDTKRWTLYEPS